MDEFQGKRLRTCSECGGMAITDLMWSVTNKDGELCWICDDCHADLEGVCDDGVFQRQKS